MPKGVEWMLYQWGCCFANLRAIKAAWLSQHILTYFSGLTSIWISYAQARMACISAWKTVAYFPRQILTLLPEDCPYILAPVSLHNLDPSVYQTSPLTAGRVQGPLVHSPVVNIVTLYLGSELNAGLLTSTPILNMGSNFWSCNNILMCSQLGGR